jgi:hypothetical protein
MFRSILRFLTLDKIPADEVAQIYSLMVRTMGSILVVAGN